MMSDEVTWTLLRTSPQTQSRYVEHVAENYPHVETYYPIYHKKTRPHGKRYPVYIAKPVYPGYVFAKINLSEDMRILMKGPVRAFFIRFGPEVSIIPDPVIDNLRRLESRGLLVREIQKADPYKPGRMVRVTLPQADIIAVIIRLLKKQNRAVVETALGRATVHIHKMTVLG